MTRKYAVLGFPIAHSKSPVIHSFLFSRTEFDGSYERFEVGDNLSEFLDSKPDFSGFSLTMPLKEQAHKLATSLDPDSIATGAVNTLLRTEGGWAGYNTDVAGIRNAVGFKPEVVCVIGSGATAQSALQAFPGSKKQIYARNKAASEKLASKFEAEIVTLPEALGAELIVSTVTEGVLPSLVAGQEIPGTLLDCVYTNPVIPAGRRISGLSMLIHQAVIQQRIFQFGSPESPLQTEPELVSGLFELLGMAK